MNTKCILVAVAAMLTGSAFAAEKEAGGVTPNLDEGTQVLEGAGNMNMMADEVQLQLAYGMFVADGVEVAAVAGLYDNDIYMSTELGLRAEYNFVSDSPLVPFLSAGAAWVAAEADDVDLDSSAAVFSVGAGVKYFIRDDVALALNMSYLVATDDIVVDSEDNELEDDDIRILFSVRYYFD